MLQETQEEAVAGYYSHQSWTFSVGGRRRRRHGKVDHLLRLSQIFVLLSHVKGLVVCKRILGEHDTFCAWDYWPAAVNRSWKEKKRGWWTGEKIKNEELGSFENKIEKKRSGCSRIIKSSENRFLKV